MSRIPTSCDRRLSRLGTILLIGGVLLTAGTGPASAGPRTAPGTGDAGRAGCQTVHAGPQQRATGARRSYFQLTLNPGAERSATVVVANPEPYPCSVTLEAASGETAVNSGDTYPIPAAGCVETSCWLQGLPATLSVPAHGRASARFGVSVPAGATPGQYLAGVVIRPTDPPPDPSAAGGKQVAVAVSARVALGVAVVVPGLLHPGLTIPAVRLDVSGPVPMLYVTVRNVGNTWEHPAGGALITSDATHRAFGVRASTVLAGDTAVLPLPAPGIARGTWPTRVQLRYAGHQVATWHGRLSYPKPQAATTPASGRSADGQRSGGRVPSWAFAVIGALGVLVLLLGIGLLLLFRRRRDDSPPASGPEDAADRAAALADASPG